MQLDVTSRFFFFLALPFIQTKSKYANISFDIKDIKEDKIHPPSLSPLFKLESIHLFKGNTLLFHSNISPRCKTHVQNEKKEILQVVAFSHFI